MKNTHNTQAYLIDICGKFKLIWWFNFLDMMKNVSVALEVPLSVLLYVGIINIVCMYHIKYYVMFRYMHCVCDMLFHICGVMLCCIYNVRLHM